VHVAPSKSITLSEAGENWLRAAEQDLERSTADQYRQHLKFHLIPFIGGRKLTDITTDIVLDLEARLRNEGRSKDMARVSRLHPVARVNAKTGGAQRCARSFPRAGARCARAEVSRFPPSIPWPPCKRSTIPVLPRWRKRSRPSSSG
jgi:hypothetical protein